MPNADLAQPHNQNIFYVNFVDGITLEKVKIVMAVCSDIYVKHKPETIYFSFSSGGGDVDAGVNLYTFLKGLPCRIIMHNTGSIDSIANVVFMAGDERYATKFSTFLFHGVRFDINGQMSLHLNQISELQDRIQKMHNKIADIICQNSKLTKKKLQKFLFEGKTEDAAFALKHGIIHDIRDFKIPENTPFVSINHT